VTNGVEALDRVAIKVLMNIEPQQRLKVSEIGQEVDVPFLVVATIVVLIRSGIVAHPPE
jgi:hypothetical protein